MVMLQIRQAEVAMKDGRLDEAYEVVRADDVRSHRQGQRLIGKLSQAFLDRGRQHLQAGRHDQALKDCERAAKLGGNLTDVAELRTAIITAMTDQQRDRQANGHTIEEARRRVDRGDLTMGEAYLKNLPENDPRQVGIEYDAAIRRKEAQTHLERAEAALQRLDLRAAADELAQVRRLHSSNERLSEVESMVAVTAGNQIKEALVGGRLMDAEWALDQVRGLVEGRIELQRCATMVTQCRHAASKLEAGRPREVVETLTRLKTELPEAQWIPAAIDAARQAAESTESLRSGPLGGLNVAKVPQSGESVDVIERANEFEPRRNVPSLDATELLGRAAETDRDAVVSFDESSVPERFLLQVDGVGSFLVLRSSGITVGPSRSSQPADVSLLTDTQAPTVSIERTEGDYFLSSPATIEINGKQVSRKLLADGDSIALSRRSRAKFQVPNAASGSAVLNLSGTRLPHGDARRVILLDDSFVMGPGSNTHIRADHLGGNAVFFVRSGRLQCRASEPVTVEDKAVDPKRGIPMNAHAGVGPVSFVVTAA